MPPLLFALPAVPESWSDDLYYTTSLPKKQRRRTERGCFLRIFFGQNGPNDKKTGPRAGRMGSGKGQRGCITMVVSVSTVIRKDDLLRYSGSPPLMEYPVSGLPLLPLTTVMALPAFT